MIIQFIISLAPGLSCILSAAFFKAVMDTLAHHFTTSIFCKWDTPFWNPLHPYNGAVKKVFRYPIDAWHIAGSGMIISFLLAAAFNTKSIRPEWYLLIMGIWHNVVFNLFYNKWLLQKKYR